MCGCVITLDIETQKDHGCNWQVVEGCMKHNKNLSEKKAWLQQQKETWQGYMCSSHHPSQLFSKKLYFPFPRLKSTQIFKGQPRPQQEVVLSCIYRYSFVFQKDYHAKPDRCAPPLSSESLITFHRNDWWLNRAFYKCTRSYIDTKLICCCYHKLFACSNAK